MFYKFGRGRDKSKDACSSLKAEKEAENGEEEKSYKEKSYKEES